MTVTENGCSECADFWGHNQRKRPDEAGVNMQSQASLFVCSNCGAYWEASQRFARILSEGDARSLFPRYFVHGH